MNTSELITKIVRDLGNRTDITSDVSEAVSSAVTYYQRERFWFLETMTAMTTSSSAAFYALPSNLGPMIDTMNLTISGHRSPIDRVHASDIENEDDGTMFGLPSRWAVFGNQLRFYPVPDKTYVYRMAYHMNLDAPSDTASNAWTQVGSELIRYRAKWDVQKHILKDEENAAETKNSEIEAYMSIMGESTRRLSTGTLKKCGW